MQAAFVAVGSELLGTDRLDTNSLFFTKHLERYGAVLVEKRVISDDEERIALALRDLVRSVDLVVVSGGLGPTADDVTREGVARAFDRQLEVDESTVARIRDRFESRGLTMPEVNRRQAEVVQGATTIANPRGTAPGQWLEIDDTAVVLLPGVPVELRGMIESTVVPWLEKRSSGDPLRTRTLRIACEHESALEESLAPIYTEFGREGISTLAGGGEICIRIKRFDPGPVARRVEEIFGERIFGFDEESLEDAVGRLLVQRGERIAVAESCTGGLLGERLTRSAGSSRYFDGGVIAYSNEVKERDLGVAPELLERHGAVSEPVARQMARGVRDRMSGPTGSEGVAPAVWGVGITGIAGPGGGTAEKPVGTVELAIEGPAGSYAKTLNLLGDRTKIRWQSSQWALELVRRMLLGGDPE